MTAYRSGDASAARPSLPRALPSRAMASIVSRNQLPVRAASSLSFVRISNGDGSGGVARPATARRGCPGHHEDLVGNAAARSAVDERQGIEFVPLDAHDRHRRVRKDAADAGVGPQILKGQSRGAPFDCSSRHRLMLAVPVQAPNAGLAVAENRAAGDGTEGRDFRRRGVWLRFRDGEAHCRAKLVTRGQ